MIIIVVIVIITISILSAIVGSIWLSKPETKKLRNSDLPPLEYKAPYCGEDTIFDEESQQCVYYAENGADSLHKVFKEMKDNIKVVKSKLEVITKPLTELSTIIKGIPYWEDKKVTNYTGGSCSCGDCAAWRGGNSGDCSGKRIAADDTHRVSCNVDRKSGYHHRCICEPGYTSVGGLCVTPNKINGGKKCCPSCVYEGTCVGAELCEGVCEPQLVEYPGVRYVCNNIDLDTNPDIRLSTNEFESKCFKDNSNNGTNEYVCADNCESSPVECSKRCLPKLWKWKKLYSDNSFVGYVQTDDFVQFENDTYNLSYCPPGDASCKPQTQVVSNDIQNCENCTDCFWELNEVTDTYDYSCNDCNGCTTNKPTGEVGDDGFRVFEQIKCNNAKGCKNCRDMFDQSGSIRNTITCNYCETSGECSTNDSGIIFEPTTNLKVYNKGGNYNPLGSSTEDYLIGGCSTHGADTTCSSGTKLVNGKERLGYLDGGFIDNNPDELQGTDCTEGGVGCINFIGGPSYGYNKNPVCYSGEYYGQMSRNVECQKLPLPGSIPVDTTSSNLVVDGVAKGMSTAECKHYFCNKWDWGSNDWGKSTAAECNAVCNPSSVVDIPDFTNVDDQIRYFS